MASRRREKPPAFQFYVKDWLSGTKNMTFAEKGMYIDLLAWSWDNGPLPTAPRAIALIVGTPLADFAKLWRAVGRKFRPVLYRNQSGLVNPRLEKVRRQLKKFIRKQQINGKKGGRPKKPTGFKPENPTPNPEKALQSAVSSLHKDQNIARVRADAKVDWFEECKRLHNLACNGRVGHDVQMTLDAERAQKKAVSA